MVERRAVASLTLLLSLFAACATSPPMSAEQRRAAASVRLLDGAPPPGHQLLGEVQGLSCVRQAGSSPDMNAAREELKVGAARLGGNAVASIVCREEGTSLADNCWKAIRCVGDAVRTP